MTATPVRPIAIVSPLGGTGRTTLTAHLATLLATRNQPCLAIDLCAQNMLGRHLGMQQSAKSGWATLAAERQWWGQAALSNSDGVDLLPFGAASTPAMDTLQREWVLTPEWLRHQLDALEVPAGSAIFLDTPLWPAPLARQALAAARIVLIVLEASARACHAQPLVAQALAMAPPDAYCAIAINRVDPRRASQRRALETLRTQWGTLLLPYLVHEDENIAQACEYATSVCTRTPHTQSSHDLQGIGQWLMDHLAAAATVDPRTTPLPQPL
jgi:cellulose synthase operon protein YhjQ